MKKLLIIVLLTAIWGISLTIQANDSILPEDKSLYFLTSQYKYRSTELDIKLYKYDYKKDIGEFNPLLIFEFTGYDMLDDKYFFDDGIIAIQDEEENLYTIKMESPWDYGHIKAADVEQLIPIKKNNTVYLGRRYGDHLTLLNIDTMENEEEYRIDDVDGYAYKLLQDRAYNMGLAVKNGNLEYIPYLRNIDAYFPYVPPEELLVGVDTVGVVFNSKDYVVLLLNTYNKYSIIEQIKSVTYNKKTQDWYGFFTEKGADAEIIVVEPYIVIRIGILNGNGFSDDNFEFTGENVILNYKTGKRNEIDLGRPSKIYYIDERYLIAAVEDKLSYIPIRQGKIMTDESTVLYKNTTDSMLLNTVDGYLDPKYIIDSVFLGPVEIPVEIKQTLGKKFNKKGEFYYKTGDNRYIRKSLYYYKLAVHYIPEYAQAYSNLGLAYLKIEKYDESIESSLKAIELTENDTIKASSYYNIAMVYEAMEEWEKALNNYQKALEYKDHDAYKEGIERMEEKLLE